MSLFKICRVTFFSRPFSSCVRHSIDRNSLRVNACSPMMIIHRYKHCEGKDIVVYEGPLSKQIQSLKFFSIMSSLAGLVAQPIIYVRAAELGTSPPLLFTVCTIVGFFTFVTPVMLNFVTKKYVTQVTHNPTEDIYNATIYTLLLKKKNVSIRPGEAIVPDVLGLFTTITVRDIPLFIDAKFFNDVHHYKRIMGYDKPMDFKLFTSEAKQ